MLIVHISTQNKKKPIVGCHNRLFRLFAVLLHGSGQMVVRKSHGMEMRCFKDDKNYDFNRYFLVLLLPSATTAPSETNSARYIFVRETCKPMASAIWVLLASGVSVKY